MTDATKDTAPDPVTVPKALAGTRLDKAVGALFPNLGLSRSRVQKLIDTGHILIRGRTAKQVSAKTTILAGDIIEITVPDAEDADPVAEDLGLDIVYEDSDLVVVNKPPGMVVHPAPGSYSGTMVNGLLHHCGASLSGIGGVKRPGIVHRIDKDTSGLLVVAKNDPAHQGLATQFADHSIERTYDAIIWGAPKTIKGRFEGAIGRHPVDRKRMAIREGGKHAVTHYRVRDIYLWRGKETLSHIECKLETGRTHQIRVHMTHIGCPLLGDPIYGRARHLSAPRNSDEQNVISSVNSLKRQALHARSLGFIHPVSGETLQFQAPCPSDMQAILDALFQKRRDSNAKLGEAQG